MSASLAAQSWYDSAWSSRQEITIDSDHTNFSLSADLTGFPYLVTLSVANDVFSRAQTDGDDILFTDSDGMTQLAHEIEVYDARGTTLVAWVRLPTLCSAADTTIYMYYGNPNVASQQRPGNGADVSLDTYDSAADGEASWLLDASGATWSVTYASIRYSDATATSGAPIPAANSTDVGNNVAGSWDFNPLGVLDHFALSAVSDPQVAGESFDITITAENSGNNTVTDFDGTVTISDQTGTVNPTTSANFVNGVVSQAVTIEQPDVDVEITVTDGVVAGQSTSFDVTSSSSGTGLLGYWKLDETSGVTAVDSSASGNDGTLTNFPATPTWSTAGRYDGALDFDGVDDYVLIPSEADYDIAGTITVAAWIKRSKAFDDQWESIVTKGDSSWRLIRNNTGDGVAFAGSGLTTNSTVGGTANVNDLAWHHIVGVYNGSALQIWVDGILDNSVAATGTITLNNEPVRIGDNSGAPTRLFDGLIDDVRIYNVALSQSEIIGLYNAPPPFITARETADLDADGFIDAVRIVFNENIDEGAVSSTGMCDRLEGRKESL